MVGRQAAEVLALSLQLRSAINTLRSLTDWVFLQAGGVTADVEQYLGGKIDTLTGNLHQLHFSLTTS